MLSPVRLPLIYAVYVHYPGLWRGEEGVGEEVSTANRTVVPAGGTAVPSGQNRAVRMETRALVTLLLAPGSPQPYARNPNDQSSVSLELPSEHDHSSPNTATVLASLHYVHCILVVLNFFLLIVLLWPDACLCSLLPCFTDVLILVLFGSLVKVLQIVMHLLCCLPFFFKVYSITKHSDVNSFLDSPSQRCFALFYCPMQIVVPSFILSVEKSQYLYS